MSPLFIEVLDCAAPYAAQWRHLDELPGDRKDLADEHVVLTVLALGGTSRPAKLLSLYGRTVRF
jgi:hypothetical protein